MVLCFSPPAPLLPASPWLAARDKTVDGNHHGNRRNRSRAEVAHYPSEPCCMLSPEQASVDMSPRTSSPWRLNSLNLIVTCSRIRFWFKYPLVLLVRPYMLLKSPSDLASQSCFVFWVLQAHLKHVLHALIDIWINLCCSLFGPSHSPAALYTRRRARKVD